MAEPTSALSSIGQRIAFYRRERGLTQEGLALRLFRSKSWVTKIERGERPLDSVRTLFEIARALGVEVRDLTGQPWFPEGGGPGHEAVLAIRRALTALSPPSAFPDGSPIQPRDAAALQRSVAEAGRLWQTEPHCYSTVIPLLPDLIAELRLAVESAGNGQQRDLNRTLAQLYHLLQEVLARLGEPDLSWIAASQSLGIAEEVDDPALTGASAWRVCHAALRVDNVDEVHDVATTAAAELRPALREPTPERLSVYGALHLVGSVAASRVNDQAAADGFLREAARTAAQLGEDRNDHWMTFGPTNVAIHDVAVLLDRGDPSAALRRGTAIDPSSLPSLERQSSHHVHLAHAHALRRQYGEATAALLVAERLNPEGLRYNMLVLDLVRALRRQERRRAVPGLRGLAERLHVLH